MENFDEKEISATIGGEEQISRFVRHEKYIRSNQTLRHEAFMPYLPTGANKLELSVFRTSNLSDSAAWKIASLLDKPPCGRGILQALDYQNNGLQIKPTPALHPRHADVVNWPDRKDYQKMIAMRLAEKAKLEYPNH